MLARHQRGTQKIVISDNIFVTERNAVTGKLSMEREREAVRASCTTAELPFPEALSLPALQPAHLVAMGSESPVKPPCWLFCLGVVKWQLSKSRMV